MMEMPSVLENHPVAAIAGALLVAYAVLCTLLARSIELPNLPWSGKKSKMEAFSKGRTWLTEGYQKV